MDVKLLQQKLRENGYYHGMPVDGILGPQTVAETKKYQAAKGITADGIVGPQTLKELGMMGKEDESEMKPIPEDVWILNNVRTVALAIAMSQNGVRERGNNSGPAVESFLRAVGLGPGYSWCMAFVYWAFAKAHQHANAKNRLIRTGGCMKQWNETKCYKTTTDPQSGDIFIMDLGGGAGHTGIVVSVDRDEVHCIEGNTNDNGSANGDGVYLRTRLRKKIKGYIRV